MPTAIVAFLRRFHGVLSRSCGVLVGDRLRAHGVLMACTRRAHRVLGAVTARARRAHGERTARARRPHRSCHFASAFASCYVCQLLFMSCHTVTSTHIMLSCQGTEPAAELKYNFRYSRCFFAAVLSRLEPTTHSSLNEVHSVCIILDLLDMQIGKEWPGLLAFNSHDEVDKA